VSVHSQFSREATRAPHRTAKARPVEIAFAPENYTSIEGSLVDAISHGMPVVIDLDSHALLDIDDVRSLIKLRRRCQDLGGELSLRTTIVQHRKMLGVTALDKLFAIETSPN
jgi:hypothetical protein